ncbi:unnamed protein product [Closterium sp. NIES-54]
MDLSRFRKLILSHDSVAARLSSFPPSTSFLPPLSSFPPLAVVPLPFSPTSRPSPSHPRPPALLPSPCPISSSTPRPRPRPPSLPGSQVWPLAPLQSSADSPPRIPRVVVPSAAPARISAPCGVSDSAGKADGRNVDDGHGNDGALLSPSESCLCVGWLGGPKEERYEELGWDERAEGEDREDREGSKGGGEAERVQEGEDGEEAREEEGEEEAGEGGTGEGGMGEKENLRGGCGGFWKKPAGTSNDHSNNESRSNHDNEGHAASSSESKLTYPPYPLATTLALPLARSPIRALPSSPPAPCPRAEREKGKPFPLASMTAPIRAPIFPASAASPAPGVVSPLPAAPSGNPNARARARAGAGGLAGGTRENGGAPEQSARSSSGAAVASARYCCEGRSGEHESHVRGDSDDNGNGVEGGDGGGEGGGGGERCREETAKRVDGGGGSVLWHVMRKCGIGGSKGTDSTSKKASSSSSGGGSSSSGRRWGGRTAMRSAKVAPWNSGRSSSGSTVSSVGRGDGDGTAARSSSVGGSSEMRASAGAAGAAAAAADTAALWGVKGAGGGGGGSGMSEVSGLWLLDKHLAAAAEDSASGRTAAAAAGDDDDDSDADSDAREMAFLHKQLQMYRLSCPIAPALPRSSRRRRSCGGSMGITWRPKLPGIAEAAGEGGEGSDDTGEGEEALRQGRGCGVGSS